MTVLKDASSSAIYGSRAANGVILVTTNRGASGKTKLNFSVRSGIQQATTKLDLCNTEEMGQLLWLEFKNEGLKPGQAGWGNLQYGYGATPVIPDYILPTAGMVGSVDESLYSYPSPYNAITKANKTGTDWYNQIFNAALLQEYNLTVSGGNDKSTYSLSAGYLNQKGIVNYTGFDRYSLRSNADTKITDWLKIGESLGVSYTDRVGAINNDEYGPEAMVYRTPPIVPVYDIMGNFTGSKIMATGNFQNPVAILYRGKDNHIKDIQILGNIYAQINFTKDLSFKSLLGVNSDNSKSLNRTLLNPEYVQANSVSSLSQNNSGIFQYNWSNTLNYQKTISGNHNINVLIGSEAVDNNSESLGASRSTYAYENVDYMIMDAGQSTMTNSGTIDRWALFSYFGRLNYDFKGKYLFEGVIRRDGSSRFVGTNRWATFPAFSAGWRISQESFMHNLTWINDLKLRVGWGQNGNDNVGNYNAYSTYRSNGNESYYNISGASRNSSTAGFHEYSLGNPNGQWEASSTTNLGLDLSMFKNRLEVNLDLYSRLTTGMLYPDSKPATFGTLVFPSVNIGKMKNNGFDLILTYRGDVGKDFKYTLRANVSHYNNKVIKLNDNPKEIRYGDPLREQIYNATTAGEPISSFYGLVVDGIFNTQAEVNAWPKYNPDINGVDSYSKPGVFKYKDINGDGKITAADRTFIGNPNPNVTYGMNIELQYKNWNMIMFFQGVQGNDVTNYTNRWTLFNEFEGNRLTRRLYESWTPERYASGAKITLPIATNNDAIMQQQSSFFIEDGSYFRMKELQIGYTLPTKITSKLKIERLQFYMEISNLFTITKYSGLDPEVPFINTATMGIDEGIYPTSQNLIFGIKLDI
jgi:TonB-linked SusC/RagA family outer membrane protein